MRNSRSLFITVTWVFVAHQLHQLKKVVILHYYNYSLNYVSQSWNQFLTAFIFATEISTLLKHYQQDSRVDLESELMRSR